MAKKSIDLLIATDPNWVNVILENFDEFLADHANCERKASALAMSMVVKYPDRSKIIPALIELAQEELQHFKEVYELMQQRGIRLIKDTQDPYVNQLLTALRHGRDQRFLDQMLIASVIECRGAERFRMIAQALTDESLRCFYRDLWACEAKHGHIFVDMVLNYIEPDMVYLRLDELMAIEAEIIQTLDWRPSLH